MSITKKIVATLTAVTCAVWMIGPSTAQAATAAELQAQIDALLAQLTTLQGQLGGLVGGTAAACTFTRPLYPGVTGADVKCLQQYLNGAGYTVAASGPGSAGNETEFFGSLTQAGVQKWQDANGIVYGSYGGYFGPVSQAKYNALMATAAGGEEEEAAPSGLQGGAGSIANADWVASLNHEEVGEDEEDVEVAGLDIEADEGSDIELTAVRLVFVYGDTVGGSSEDFEDYADDVSLWFEGDEVARVDGDKFNDDNDYSRTISLDSGSIIDADEEGRLVVAVSGIRNLDSDDEGEEWSVVFDSIRFRDAQGSVITDNDTGDIGDERDFTFETFATAANVELELIESDDNPPEQIVEASETTETDHVLLASGTLEAKGSDIDLNEVTITVTPVAAAGGGDGDVSEMASQFTLEIDGDEVDTVDSDDCDDTAGACDGSGADDATDYTFDDVDLTIDEGDTVDFEVYGDILALDADPANPGDSLSVDVDADDFDAEDEAGEDLDDDQLTGMITGNPQYFFEVAPQITLVSAEITKNTGDDCDVEGTDDTADAVIKFKVKAIGGTIYINAFDTTTADNAGVLVEDGAGTDLVPETEYTYTATGSGVSLEDDGTDEYWEIPEGKTATFTLSVHLDPAADGFYGADVTDVQWGTDDTDEDTRIENTIDFGTVADDLETSLVNLCDGA
jgi:peptidoglycan hydrolase-like protein with peptidoglycan-binding domain